MSTPAFGIYRGVCTNANGLQLKIRVPQLLGGSELAAWAEPCLPPATALDDHPAIAAHTHDVSVYNAPFDATSTGTTSPAGAITPRAHVQHATAPRVGEGVWVMFEGGDVDHPVWLGVFGSG